MSSALKGADIISIRDLSVDTIDFILAAAQRLKERSMPDLLKSCVLASCFFEPSTRTRLSFESAMIKLGGGVIGFSEAQHTSVRKGETLQDSMRILSGYADIIVLRHPQDGAARLAAELSAKPVINAGDGVNQHPSQTLLDLFTIQECQQRLDGLHIAFVGDLKYGRTAHSLAQALSYYQTRFFFVSPENLMMPQDVCSHLKKFGRKFSHHRSIEEVLQKIDILYMTRIQKERFDESEFHAISQHYLLTASMLQQVKSNFKVLHPLPRIHEIDRSVDATPYAYYFQQAENGLYVRQALLALLLGKMPS